MCLRQFIGTCVVAGCLSGGGGAFGQVLGTVGESDPANDAIGGANPIPLSSNGVAVIRGDLVGAGSDVDHFSISLLEGDVLTIITAPTNNLPIDFFIPDTSVSVLDSGGVQQVVNADAGSDYGRTGVQPQVHGAVVRFRAPSAQTYYVRVFGGGLNESGTYFVAVSLYRGGATRFAEVEPNGTIAAARFIDLTTGGPMLGSGAISPANDLDVYGVELRGGDSVLAVITPTQNLPANFGSPDTVLEVLDSSGAVLLMDDDAGDEFPSAGGAGVGSAVRFRAPRDGNYYLRIRGFSGAETGSYVLTLATIPGRPCIGDADRNGFVDFSDVLNVLSGFATVCP